MQVFVVFSKDISVPPIMSLKKFGAVVICNMVSFSSGQKLNSSQNDSESGTKDHVISLGSYTAHVTLAGVLSF